MGLELVLVLVFEVETFLREVYAFVVVDTDVTVGSEGQKSVIGCMWEADLQRLFRGFFEVE